MDSERVRKEGECAAAIGAEKDQQMAEFRELLRSDPTPTIEMLQESSRVLNEGSQSIRECDDDVLSFIEWLATIGNSACVGVAHELLRAAAQETT